MTILTRRPKEPVHEFQTRRRAEAVRLFETTDLGVTAVAKQIGVTRKYVGRWHAAWKKGDAACLAAQRSGGKSRLTDEQKEAIRQKIIAGPKAAGYEQQLWNQKRIAALVLQETGISYHPNFMRVLMASLQISYQKPVLRPKQQSAAKIAEFVEVTFPEVKKSL
jgi:transposase